MFKELFNFIFVEYLDRKISIFVHNLGAFDGYFIFKYASILYPVNKVKSIIDNDNKFISILVNKIKFTDSYRIFGVSLNDLCNVFNQGQGKTNAYNPEYNSIFILNNPLQLTEFKNYADNDSIILYKCMLNASLLYKENYDVDLSDCLSMTSLSMLIFRKKFLKVKIPVLDHKLDEFVRDSYYGGSTDYYKKYAKNVYYYDVNSLYPYAMLKDIPLKPLRWVDESTKLEDLFGFALVKVHCPKTIKKPILPKKHNGKTIYPTPRPAPARAQGARASPCVGVYYSEELKAVEKYGYNIEIIKGLEFSRANIFKDYKKKAKNCYS
uniref:DNA-directed DNA polymerase n=1 Tax=Pappia fissilis TaxID=1040649 RepID=UPI002A834EFC|nr:DNA-directed DNA polymerase [Pappia fissilis]WOX61292.1 DNA-directed DNA polymerase [Pappia fissilis]